MALVSKILEATLAAGSTSVTFTDSDIPNSLIRVYSSDSTIIPESRILSGNSLTVIYAPQTNAIGVAVEIVKQGLDIIDGLDSADADKALSAKQGRALKLLIDSIPEGKVNISDMNDVDITDIEDGQVLAWDEVSGKFVNVDQSGGESGANNYSTDETIIGTWIDDSNIYRKVFKFDTAITCNSNQWANTDILTSSLNVKQLIKAIVSSNDVVLPFAVSCDINNTYVALLNVRSSAVTVNTLIVEYTKNS